MTNKFNNWERLSQVIERFGVTINQFAKIVGLQRSETLYHIRKGTFGISADLADRIVAADSNIDRTWLLSGVGNMLRSEPVACEKLPFYRCEMEGILAEIDNYPSDGEMNVPYSTGSDYVVRSFSKAMSDTVTAANDLFLKRVDKIEDVVQGNEYVLQVSNKILWRRVRFVKDNPRRWRLVSDNRTDFPDIYVNVEDVVRAWRVMARVAILES